MSEHIALERPLLASEAPKLEAIQNKLIAATAQFMPTTSEYVSFTNPNKAAIAILGGNIIDWAIHSSAHGYELPYLNPHQIACEVANDLAPLPSTIENVTAQCIRPQFSPRLEGQSLTAQLNMSPIVGERRTVTATLCRLGGIPPAKKTIHHYGVRLVKFRVTCPIDLKEELIKITADHLPTGTPLTFGPIEPIDTAVNDFPYYNLDAATP